jgi:hypothetical protein
VAMHRLLARVVQDVHFPETQQNLAASGFHARRAIVRLTMSVIVQAYSTAHRLSKPLGQATLPL